MIIIDGQSLTLEQVIAVSSQNESIAMHPTVAEKMAQSRRFVEKILDEKRTVYGITTGFGQLANQMISPRQSQELQENLIRSHAVGVGDPLTEETVRAMMLLRINALIKGYSGIRQEVTDLLISMLNNRIYPHIPSQGSVGASGDLAPLAHLALTMMGEGECFYNRQKIPSKEVLARAQLAPIQFQAKEGLALINGTQMMAAIGCLAVQEAFLLIKNAQIAGAMSLEALKGTARAYDEKIHLLRPHPGQNRIAANMRRLVAGSKIIESHINCEKVQDAYTLRCIPQVYGAILDTLEYAKQILTVEINSVTDNPLIFADEEEVISGGNFHGEPLAFAMDFLGISLAEIANISERTVDRLVNPNVSELPAFLSPHSGLNSGFMITQYTAASLVSENKILAHPASVDSIPTSAGQEDHVSMGSISARKAIQIIRNVEYVLAIEMLCAAQGIDFREYTPGKGTRAAYQFIRQHIPSLDHDRVLYPDIDRVRQMVVKGEIVAAVEKEIGALT